MKFAFFLLLLSFPTQGIFSSDFDALYQSGICTPKQAEDLEALNLAIEEGNDEKAKTLFKKNPWLKEFTGEQFYNLSPILRAYRIKNFSLLLSFLSLGAKPYLDELGMGSPRTTLVSMAIWDENVDLLTSLLKMGYGFDLSNDEGGKTSDLYTAIFKKNKEMVKLLLDHGYPFKKPLDRMMVSVGFDHSTFLIAALKKGTPEIVKLLLDYGADPKDVGYFYGLPPRLVLTSPLELSMNEETTEALLKAGALPLENNPQAGVKVSTLTLCSLYEAPSYTAKVLIKLGPKVLLRAREVIQTSEGSSDYWFKVTTLQGLRGWASSVDLNYWSNP